MKIIAIATVCTLAITSTAYSKPLFQAGDIAVGQLHTITKDSGPASYYKNGVSGKIDFNCVLTGENVKALLYPGKNFTPNLLRVLSVGMNGPYTWTLHDLGENTGNIKIKLVKGTEATIQCKQIS